MHLFTPHHLGVVLRVVVCGVVLVVSRVLLWCYSCRVMCWVVLVVCLCVWPVSLLTPSGLFLLCVCVYDLLCCSCCVFVCVTCFSCTQSGSTSSAVRVPSFRIIHLYTYYKQDAPILWSFVVLFLSCVVWCCSCRVFVCVTCVSSYTELLVLVVCVCVTCCAVLVVCL